MEQFIFFIPAMPWFKLDNEWAKSMVLWYSQVPVRIIGEDLYIDGKFEFYLGLP